MFRSALPWIAGAALGASTSAQGFKVSRLHPLPVGDVDSMQWSPDGSRIVYRADDEVDGRYEIFSVLADGSAGAVRLNAASPASAVAAYAVSPDGTRVVYISGSDLYCVPIDGAAAPVMLNAPLPSGHYVARLVISPTSDRVAFVEGTATSANPLFSVPIDGSAPAIQLAANSGLDVRITPDGQRVIFPGSGYQAYCSESDLYTVPIAGGSAPVLLGWAQNEFPLKVDYEISPDSARVVYASCDGLSPRGAYSVPSDGSSAPIRLSGAVLSDVQAVLLSPDGSRTLYVADEELYGRFEVYGVPTDGSAPSVELSDNQTPGSDVSDFAVSADGIHVAFIADRQVDERFDLYSVPVDGSAPPTLLVQPSSGDVESLEIDATGARVVHAQGEYLSFSLHSVPIDASAPSVQLAPVVASRTAYQVSPDGTRVVYTADLGTDQLYELYQVPTDGSASPVKLNAPLPAGGDVGSVIQIGPNGLRVAYVADQIRDDVQELFSVPIDGSAGPARLNGELQPERTLSTVLDFQLGPAGRWAVYRADADTYGLTELYGASDLGHAKLNGPLEGADDVLEYRFAPNGARVLFRVGFNPFTASRLFSVPVDASAQALLLLDYSFIAAYEADPTSRRVVVATQTLTGSQELLSIPIDGSGPPVLLHLDPQIPIDTTPVFVISPDGSRVLFRQNGDLLSMPADGSAAAVEIDGAPKTLAFAASPDSTRALYLTNGANHPLFSAPIDGSGPGIRLSGTMVTGGQVVDFVASPDSSRVVYRADQSTNEVFELFSAPLAGGAAPVRISAGLVPGGDVGGFAISPDSTLVVYAADQNLDESIELFSVPIDGSAAPVRLHPALVAGGDVGTFAISPDSSRVVYCADQEADERFELFSAPIGGGSVKLSGALVAGGDVFEFQVAADAARVCYRADARTDGVDEVFSVPIDASAPPARQSRPPVAGGDVRSFRISAAGKILYYLADQDTDEVPELYANFLLPQDWTRRGSAPTTTVTVVR